MKKADIYCANCGKQLWETNTSGYCLSCFNKIIKKTIKDYFCADCGKKLNHYKPGKRCYSCNSKHQRQIKPLFGKLNPNYNGGLPKCCVCNKTLSNYHNKYCRNHAKTGIRHPLWKGGIAKCSDCHKPLGSYIAKRCRTCNAKHYSGKRHHNYGKAVQNVIQIKYKQRLFRSSWEANFAKWCDLSGIKWEYEPTAFEVRINKKDTTYTPDFYLPDFDCWIEIKGWWYRNSKAKYLWFLKKYKNVVLLQYKQLQEFGIIR